MSDVITLAPKILGAMALEDFCPRCWWIQQKAKIPYQFFPGIFSSIDAYSKKIVHHWIDKCRNDPKHPDYKSVAPSWIPRHGMIKSYFPSVHWSKFSYTDPVTGIMIRGVPDDRFEMNDGSVMIPDYKTAKFTDTQDKVLPMYAVQNNCYAIIQNRTYGHTVSSIPLIYCEPVIDIGLVDQDNYERLYCADGFNMKFSVHVVEIEIDPSLVFDLLKKAWALLHGHMPDGRENCPDCKKLGDLVNLIYSETS